MIGSLVAYDAAECDPVELTRRLHALQITRANLRRARMERDGILRPTPYLDRSIEQLEELLSVHLPNA